MSTPRVRQKDRDAKQAMAKALGMTEELSPEAKSAYEASVAPLVAVSEGAAQDDGDASRDVQAFKAALRPSLPG
jgi:hypothetical protein